MKKNEADTFIDWMRETDVVCEGAFVTLCEKLGDMVDDQPDPMRQYVGTNRLMFTFDAAGNMRHGFLLGIATKNGDYHMQSATGPDGDTGEYWAETCRPYYTDTAYAVEQLMAGKVLVNEHGSRVYRTEGSGFVMKYADGTLKNKVTINFIAAHTWHTVEG